MGKLFREVSSRADRVSQSPKAEVLLQFHRLLSVKCQ